VTVSKNKSLITLAKGTFVLLFIVSVFFNWLYFKEKQEQERKFQIFLNHYYIAINDSLYSINRLLDSEQSSKEGVNRDLIMLSEQFKRFAYISSLAAYYAGAHPSGSNLFELAANAIMFGTQHKGEQIHPFIENDQLRKSEIVFLTEIKKHLEYIHAQLYSVETGQENPHLSKDEFRSIAGYVTWIVSEYDSLLEKYLEN
jgi:hypothetical protein